MYLVWLFSGLFDCLAGCGWYCFVDFYNCGFVAGLSCCCAVLLVDCGILLICYLLAIGYVCFIAG